MEPIGDRVRAAACQYVRKGASLAVETWSVRLLTDLTPGNFRDT